MYMREHHSFVKTVEGSVQRQMHYRQEAAAWPGCRQRGVRWRGEWEPWREGESLSPQWGAGECLGGRLAMVEAMAGSDWPWCGEDGGSGPRGWARRKDPGWGGSSRREGVQCACLPGRTDRCLWLTRERGGGGSSLRLATHLWAQMVLGDGSITGVLRERWYLQLSWA